MRSAGILQLTVAPQFAIPDSIMPLHPHAASRLTRFVICKSAQLALAAIALLALAGRTTAAPPDSSDAPSKPRLALTPPMGWNSWEAFRRDFDEDVIKAQADAMVASGLRDAGYTYLVIDGGWKPGSRDDAGNIIPDPKKFPHGMKAVADYIHSKGLKFGLHQPAGIHDCPKLSPGSQNNEDRDGKLLAEWGIDFIKYDLCDYIFDEGTVPGSPDIDRFVLRKGETTVFTSEAEAVQNHLTGLAHAERRDSCSGGRCVTAIGYDKGAIIIPDVNVPADGIYSFDIHYSNPYFGQGNRFKQMTFFVSASDAAPRRVDLPYNVTERYTPGVVTVELNLKQGRNTLTVANPVSQEEQIRQSYLKMASALNRSGREIVFSFSGAQRPWLWGQPIAHLYRCEGDIIDRWAAEKGNTVMSVLDRHIPLLDHAAIGFWPDPDMLEVGRKGRIDRPNVSTPAMTDAEYRAQFSLWCIMNAPLFISMDLRQIDDATKQILLNKDVIAINQDPAGHPCRCIRSAGNIQIFAKNLADNSVAVALLNRGPEAADAELRAIDLGIVNPAPQTRDLWTGQTITPDHGLIKTRVPSHGVVLLRVK
jgi:hypothetical protein